MNGWFLIVCYLYYLTIVHAVLLYHMSLHPSASFVCDTTHTTLESGAVCSHGWDKEDCDKVGNKESYLLKQNCLLISSDENNNDASCKKIARKMGGRL